MAGTMCKRARVRYTAARRVRGAVVADAGDAREVAEPPLAGGVRLASVLIRPRAWLACADASRGVPVANTVGKTLGLAGGEAQARAARGGARLPLAVGIGVATTRDGVLEGALRSAGAVAVRAHKPAAIFNGRVLALNLAGRQLGHVRAHRGGVALA